MYGCIDSEYTESQQTISMWQDAALTLALPVAKQAVLDSDPQKKAQANELLRKAGLFISAEADDKWTVLLRGMPIFEISKEDGNQK